MVKKNIVPIVFITDNNYAIPTYITILSLKKTKLFSSIYNIYFLYTDVDKSILNNLSKLSSEDFCIKTIKVNNKFKNLKLNKLHVSTTAIIKFELGTILSELDKVLYLDGDIIVQKDLSNLYSTDITNEYAGVVKDIAPMLLYSPNMNKKLGVNHRHYFNSGVMLLNLKKIREDNIQKELIDYREHGLNFFMDQDALNVCFKDNVKYLNVTNNFLVTLLDRFSINDICKYYNTSLEESFSNSTILHFASKFKPWKYYGVNYFDIWNDVYKISPYCNFYKRSYRYNQNIIISLTSYPARINTVNQVIESLLNQTMKADKVILWLAPEQFPNGEADLPKQLLDLKEKGLTIDWYKDIRSYKKLIPTLKKYPEAIIVTADDDIIYPNNWLEKLYKSYKENPKCIHANRAHHFTYNKPCIRYNDFINSDKLKNRKYKKFSLLPTGCGGILYPPNVLNNNVFDEEKAFKLCKDCDDIWFWINALLNKTKIILIPNRIKYIYKKAIQETQTVSLYKYNCQEGGGNDIALKNIFTEYPNLLTILKKEIPFYKTILDFFIRKKNCK